jgi:Carbohydrate esterase, sialic acid-specific acetylesterase
LLEKYLYMHLAKHKITHKTKQTKSSLKLLICLAVSACLISCGGSSDSATAIPIAAAAPTPNPTPRPTLGTGNGKLKIFILAGQSNMEGYGKVDRGGDPDRATIVCPKGNTAPNILGGMGSLRAMVKSNLATYGYLVDASKTITYTVKEDIPNCVKADTQTYPGWVTRNDVWVSYWDEKSPGVTVEKRNGALGVGFGVGNEMPEGYIGPEFGFGHIVGNALGDKVLLIKTAWGGKSLAADFRPPSSGGTVGPYYTEMVAKARMVLADVKTYYPDYDGKGYEIAGFGWHQGWNDRVNTAFVAQYEVNLANLIRDLRKDLNTSAMPVVIANTGMADADKDPTAVKLIMAQANVSDPKLYPEFAGTVSTVDTRPFHYPSSSPEIGFIYHWNYNGESYFHIGEGMGAAMLKLLKP